MGENLRQVLLNLHYNIVTNLDSDKISNEETETLIFLDQNILENLQKEDIKNGVDC